MEIPDKQYFKIGDVARLLNEPPHVIRYWESEFPVIKPRRAGTSQQRLYRREDVELFLGIKSMLRDKGYTVAGVRKILCRENVAIESEGNRGGMVAVSSDALRAIREGLIALRDALAAEKRGGSGGSD